jgi:hypothetical protein
MHFPRLSNPHAIFKIVIVSASLSACSRPTSNLRQGRRPTTPAVPDGACASLLEARHDCATGSSLTDADGPWEVGAATQIQKMLEENMSGSQSGRPEKLQSRLQGFGFYTVLWKAKAVVF